MPPDLVTAGTHGSILVVQSVVMDDETFVQHLAQVVPGLSEQQVEHLRQTLELDPPSAESRAALLGFLRVVAPRTSCTQDGVFHWKTRAVDGPRW